ncbi:Silicatein [Geodia barretti]|uniref:Silicatein n=2 Tax=Geodia barretti TaxID=519541 RepID=A0AA35TJY0_GEOBA|nr:Silicatein [Geodia barretti]
MCVSSSNTHNVSRGLSGKYGHLFKKFNTSQYKYSLPDDIDWRTSGAVTSVKDQLRCSSSYAFAAIGALEGAMALSGDSLVSLSAQNLVDCSVPYGNHGCSCGNLNSAYLYIIDNEGIDSNYYYQYKSRQLSCNTTNRYKAASMSGVVSINSGDEGTSNQQWPMLDGSTMLTPVTAPSNSKARGSWTFNCSRSKLTHAMVIIGYSSGRRTRTWLLKNRYT